MKNLTTFLLIAILILFIMWRECSRVKPKNPIIRTDTTFVIIEGDSIPYPVEIIKKVPYPVYVDTGSTRWRDKPVDTMAILADYFTKYHYSDTLLDDTSAFIQLVAHTWKNRLYYDSLIFQNRRKTSFTTIVNNEIRKDKFKLYIGASAGFGEIPRFAINLLATLPKGYAIGTGYDFTNRNFEISAYFLLRLRK